MLNMSYLEFLAGAMVISLSGVMAPGPMVAVTVGKGSESPHAGVMIAVGHGVVEFPLMAAIFFGFGYLFSLPYVKPSIGLAGGLVLLVMAVGMFRSMRGGDVTAMQDRRSPLLAGIVLSTANPYFLIWWATIGAAMVMRSAEFGIAGLVIFMFCHWLCDFVWCWFLSAISFKGGHFFGKSFQKAIFAVSGIALLIFGMKFIYEAMTAIL